MKKLLWGGIVLLLMIPLTNCGPGQWLGPAYTLTPTLTLTRTPTPIVPKDGLWKNKNSSVTFQLKAGKRITGFNIKATLKDLGDCPLHINEVEIVPPGKFEYSEWIKNNLTEQEYKWLNNLRIPTPVQKMQGGYTYIQKFAINGHFTSSTTISGHYQVAECGMSVGSNSGNWYAYWYQ
jgi:hypothetical protein